LLSKSTNVSVPSVKASDAVTKMLVEPTTQRAGIDGHVDVSAARQIDRLLQVGPSRIGAYRPGEAERRQPQQQRCRQSSTHLTLLPRPQSVEYRLCGDCCKEAVAPPESAQ